MPDFHDANAADIASGYDFGSLWHNTSDGGVFLCRDEAEGAADWQELTFV
jgi:hypothetical protein